MKPQSDESFLRCNGSGCHAQGRASQPGAECSGLGEHRVIPGLFTRREFVKLTSAPLLLSGAVLTSCRRPAEKIVPFIRSPEGYVPGTFQYYATAMPLREIAIPILVKSFEGHPIKIEPNELQPDQPMHSSSRYVRVGTTPQVQAAILGLYDPDRAARFVYKGQTVPRETAMEILKQISGKFAHTRGKGLCFLLERSSSPSRARLLKLLVERLPEASCFVHEPVDFAVHREAATSLFGVSVRPVYRLERARRILSIDCDFLACEEDAPWMIAGYASSRWPDTNSDRMNRLYVVESAFTLTGSNADHRLSVSPSQLILTAMLLFSECVRRTNGSQSGSELNKLASIIQSRVQRLPMHVRNWATTCINDLCSTSPGSVVVAGYRQPPIVHLLAHGMNVCLGAVGHCVDYVEWPAPGESTLVDLAEALGTGAVDTLVIVGGNPVYTAPAALEWAKTQRKAQTVVRLGEYEDETFPFTDLHLPRAHFLESWGDARTRDGTMVPIQPLIAPIFGGMTDLELLARLCGSPTTNPYDIVRETFHNLVGEKNLEQQWHRFLHDGYLADSAFAVANSVSPNWSRILETIQMPEVVHEYEESTGSFEVVFLQDNKVDDGRYANNGWLQELPDPITKITWDNVVALGPADATRLGIHVPKSATGNVRVPIIRVEVNGRAMEGPAWIVPGIAHGTIAIALGYGRWAAGRVGTNVGFNVYPLRSRTGSYFATGVRVTTTDRSYPIACTQWQRSPEERFLLAEANYAAYRSNPQLFKTATTDTDWPKTSLYPNPIRQLTDGARYQWGMAIDLSLCIGCGACVIACQSENNVPIVGKSEVLLRREMHWIRVDQYQSGSETNPRIFHVPMLCQHCEAAPCESVCPVSATTHTDEGLNVMTYNRCVGTRYCSNNCPFKVRRFNYFDYHKRPIGGHRHGSSTSPSEKGAFIKWLTRPGPETKPKEELNLMKMMMNPEVTVRMRGVMEKCTFCVQRIEQARISSKVASTSNNLGATTRATVETACQQACPAGAITFGNMKNPENRVAQAISDLRAYRLLNHLNLQQRVVYLARITNPNPAMPVQENESKTTSTAS